jgi:hypothetical protein
MNINFAPSEDNEKLIGSFKALGYPTKTALLNDALRVFKREKAKDLRTAKRNEMLKNYAKSRPEHLLGVLDGEDFQD